MFLNQQTLMNVKILTLVAFFCFPFYRTQSQPVSELEQINRDVWEKFYMAFDSLDYQYMAGIHTKDLIRIEGNRQSIIDYDTYINNYKVGYRMAKERN